MRCAHGHAPPAPNSTACGKAPQGSGPESASSPRSQGSASGIELCCHPSGPRRSSSPRSRNAQHAPCHAPTAYVISPLPLVAHPERHSPGRCSLDGRQAASTDGRQPRRVETVGARRRHGTGAIVAVAAAAHNLSGSSEAPRGLFGLKRHLGRAAHDGLVAPFFFCRSAISLATISSMLFSIPCDSSC